MRIGLVSPYPAGLTEASIAYWREHGFTSSPLPVPSTRQHFHPIYDFPRQAPRMRWLQSI